MKRSRELAKDSGAEEASINLTPLIDVVFVVLIMFIIVAPMLEVDRVKLASAAHHQEKEVAMVQENSGITLHVHEDDTVWFNKKQVSFEQLLPLLKTAKKRVVNKTPQVFHDKRAHFETYQRLKNVMEEAGFEEMDIILQPN